VYSIVFHGHAVTLFSFARFRRPAAFATAAFAVLFADPSFVVSALSLCISAHTSSLVASAFPFAFATIAALTAVAALTAATTLAILAASPATVFATLARRVATQAASPVIFNAFASAFASLVALFAATALAAAATTAALAAAAAATVRGISHAFAMSFGSLFAFSLCVPLQTAALAVLFASTLSARRKSTHSSAFPECIHKHGTYHTKTFDVLMHGLERYGLSRSHFCDSLSQVTQLRKDTLEDLFEDPSLLASF